MKKFLTGSNRKGAQSSVDNIQPTYPQSALSPDPRNPPPLQYRAPDQQVPQQQPQRQPEHPIVGRTPSQRRISQQQQQPHLEQQPHQQLGYLPNPQQIPHPDDNRPPEYRHSSYLPNPQALNPPQGEERERRRLRDRFGLGSNKPESSSKSGINRSVSIRGNKGSPNPERATAPPDDGGKPPGPQWTTRQNISQTLLSPNEDDEEAQHNQFVAQQQRQYATAGRPPVPLKDVPAEQLYHQQQQAYYPPPGTTLQQVPTNQSIHSSSGSEVVVTPELVQKFHEAQLDIQRGIPPVQLSEHELLAVQQILDRQYQHYPPPQGAQGAQGAQVPFAYDHHHAQQLDTSPSDTLAGAPSQVSLPSTTATEQPLELHQPQATRVVSGPPQTQDSLFLTAGNTAAPAQQGIQSPPSPFVPVNTSTEHLLLQQPPSPSAPAPSPMPPPSRSGGGTIRPVGGGADKPLSNQQSSSQQQQMHSSSRESSMTQQHGAQGQVYRGQGGGGGAAAGGPGGGAGGGAGQQQGEDGGGVGGGGAGQMGRNTPSNAGVEMSEEEHYHALLKEHKELKEKYQKVKKYYFEKESQVHQLQNTLANQRLSASRTSLDDSEYSARFERIAGLTAQLAYAIRKNWKTIPDFLHRVVNKEAVATGKQEMTAVGRAYISWWLYLEVFERVFHPDLDLHLSLALKAIGSNIRRCAPPLHSAEEEEALSSKVASWRMATLEGVNETLRSPTAGQNRANLVAFLNEKLIADISGFMTDPPPSDLAGGVYMIVDLAVNIASHLPVESREVIIEYYPPMSYVQPDLMKLETGIPALTNAIAPAHGDGSPSDSTGTGGSDEREKDAAAGAAEEEKREEEPARRSRGVLAGLMGAGGGGKQQQQTTLQKTGPKANGGRDAPQGGRETPLKEERVRMAIGLGVAIRGRSVLVKAPVYTSQL